MFLKDYVQLVDVLELKLAEVNAKESFTDYMNSPKLKCLF